MLETQLTIVCFNYYYYYLIVLYYWLILFNSIILFAYTLTERTRECKEGGVWAAVQGECAEPQDTCWKRYIFQYSIILSKINLQ